MTFYLKIEASEALVNAMVNNVPGMNLEEILKDGSVHPLDFDRIIAGIGLTPESFPGLFAFLKGMAGNAAENTAMKDPDDLYFIQNKSTGSWLKPNGDGYEFEQDMKGAAAFPRYSAEANCSKLQKTFPEFEIMIVHMKTALGII